MDRQQLTSSRRRQYRFRQGTPAHQFSVAAGRTRDHRDRGIPIRAVDRLRGEVRFAAAACRSRHRTTGGRHSARLARRA